jgi:WD40 repeat protein
MESAMGIARVWPQPAVKPLPTNPILRVEPGEHTAMVSSIDTDATGQVLVMGSLDKTVRVWSLPKGQLLNTLRLPIGAGNEGQVYMRWLSPQTGPPWRPEDGRATNGTNRFPSIFSTAQAANSSAA